jgi:hypothetical protein
MAGQVHYEVFVRRGAARSFSLHDAVEKRDEAIKAAETLFAEGAAAVKVIKETYSDATGEFQALTVFEESRGKPVKLSEDGAVQTLIPCISPDDFYSAHGRATLTRLIGDQTARWKVTVSELVYRADLLEKLEAMGSLYQHAVQKVAIAQSQSSGQKVPQIMRALFDLAERAIQRIYKDERAGRFPAHDSADSLMQFAQKAGETGEGAWRTGGALAKYLQPATNWGDKILRILALVEADTGACPAFMKQVDGVAAEAVAGAGAIQELLGPQPELGAALTELANLYLGRAPAQAAPGLTALAKAFGANKLPDARTAVARRVLAEIAGPKRLAAALAGELKHLKAITIRLVMGPQVLVSHDDIVASVTLRSRRLVLFESVQEWLREAAQPDEKIERLLQLEENVVGAENKRRVWDHLAPLATGHEFEAQMAGWKQGPVAALLRTGALALRAKQAGFAEACKEKLLAVLDRASVKAAAQGKLFAGFAARADAGHAGRHLTEALAAGGLSVLPQIRNQIIAALVPLLSSGLLAKALSDAARDRGAAAPDKDAEAVLIKADLIRPPQAARAAG